MGNPESSVAAFQGDSIRKTFFEDAWWFVVEDIIVALTGSNDPKQYVQKMKQRDPWLEQGWVQIVRTLPVMTTGGSQRMNCTDTKGAFRLIQSVPSSRAEPFKKWLAKVGHERIQEIENPELAQQRMRELYAKKGYSDEWIQKRVRGIAVRDELTDEWRKRGVVSKKPYSILTSEISQATFGLTPRAYKNTKGTVMRENERNSFAAQWT